MSLQSLIALENVVQTPQEGSLLALNGLLNGNRVRQASWSHEGCNGADDIARGGTQRGVPNQKRRRRQRETGETGLSATMTAFTVIAHGILPHKPRRRKGRGNWIQSLSRAVSGKSIFFSCGVQDISACKADTTHPSKEVTILIC
jgi:hypothetical protein